MNNSYSSGYNPSPHRQNIGTACELPKWAPSKEDSPVSAQPEISARMDGLDVCLGQLAGEIQALFERLEPVLMPARDLQTGHAGGVGPAGDSSPIAQRIDGDIQCVNELRDMLRNLMSRLAV